MTTPAAERPFLTRAESELMDLLWRHGPSTVHALIERMERGVAYTTVLTLMRILEQKGYVKHQPHPDGGRSHLYTAAVEATRAKRRHVRDLLERLFAGNAEELVSGLLEDEALSPAALRALRERIDAQLAEAPKGKKR
jgi:predicted transcriptional regulator